MKVTRNAKLVKQYADEHTRCQSCGMPKKHSHRFDVHHILGGANRTDERCNFLLLCGLCHRAMHESRPNGREGMLRCHMIWLKQECDDFDLARLCEIAAQAMPEPVKPPDWVFCEREHWGYVPGVTA